MAVKTTLFIASRTEQENYILQKKLESLEYEFSGLSISGVHPAGLANSADPRSQGKLASSQSQPLRGTVLASRNSTLLASSREIAIEI